MRELCDITKKVRKLIHTYNIDRRDLAECLNVTPSVINQRLVDWAQWQDGDMEKINDLIERSQLG